MTGRSELEDAAIATLDAMSAQIARSPLASGQALIALDFLLGPVQEIVLTGSTSDTAPLMRAVQRRFLPNKVVLTRDENISDEELPEAVRPLLSGKVSRDRGLAFICERGTCHAPVATPEEVARALDA